MSNYNVQSQYHSKKRRTHFVCVPIERMDKRQFNAERFRAGELDGWYSRKFGTNAGGFAFLDETVAREFAGAVAPDPDALSVPIDVTPLAVATLQPVAAISMPATIDAVTAEPSPVTNWGSLFD